MSTRRIAAILAITAFASVAGSAQPSTPNQLRSLAPADLDAFITRVVAEQRAIGVSVGVMQDGRVVFNKGFGLANTARNTAVTPDTIFAVGSVSKQFTCAVALQMEEEGKLSFDQRVSRYRADFGHANEITLRDLGNHVSGLAEGYTPLGLGPAEPSIPEGEGWIGAAGGVWSTPTDLMKWDLALMEGKVLKPASWKTMTTPRALTGGRSSAYGCGQSICDRGPLMVLTHGGAVSGFGARNAMIPETRSAVVVMANADWASGVLDTIQEAVLEKLLPTADAPKVTGAPAREVALTLLKQIRSGAIDRALLGAEFNAFLTPQRLSVMSKSLVDAGEIGQADPPSISERGGLEVSSMRVIVGTTPVRTLMYRAPDGTIEEFLFYRR